MNSTIQGEHEGEREFLHRIWRVSRDVGDLHSQGGSISQVDLVESRATQRHKADILAIEDIQRARIEDVIYEGADRGMSFRQQAVCGLSFSSEKSSSWPALAFAATRISHRKVWC